MRCYPELNMAKRSDFAQKLLDDLRLRKERMAAASQTSNRPKTTTIDAYAYSKQIHRGSKNTKAQGMSVPKTGNTTNTRFGGGNKSPMTTDTSNQIVPYTSSRNSEQIGDLSMALAFALENGGKLRGNVSPGNNLMLGFLQQIGTRSFEVGRTNKRGGLDRNHNASGYFPTISHLHIKEISKGAQKLNQILRTCSSGIDFGRCSFEIGQELLKGAIDLEESLRMLVNLHEASEHMTKPQHKNRIVLLENEEDVEENKDELRDQKLYRPRFSLDKLSPSSRSSQDVERTGQNQKLATVRYTAVGGNFNNEQTVKLSLHRRSATYGHDVKTSNTHEKLGISNVIAKLMGLDKLSDNSKYEHKDSGSNQKVTKKANSGTNYKESLPNSKNLKPTKSDKNSAVVNTKFASQTMNNFPKNDASFQKQNKDEMRQRVPNQKGNMEGLTKQLHVKHIDYCEGHTKPRRLKESELNTTERDRKRGELKENETQQMEARSNKKSERAILLLGHKERTLPWEKRPSGKLQTKIHQKLPNSPKYQQPPMLHKSLIGEINHQREEKKQKNGKPMVKERNQKRSGSMFGSSTKSVHETLTFPKKQNDMNNVRQSLPNNRCPENSSIENNCYDLNDKTSEVTRMIIKQSFSSRDSQTTFGKERVMEKQHANIPRTNDLQSTKMQKIDGPMNNEAYTRKHHSSMLLEIEQNKRENLDALHKLEVPREHESKEVKTHCVESEETIESVQPPNSTRDEHELTEHVSTSPSPAEDECHSLKEPQISASNDSSHKTISTSTSNQQDQRSVFGRCEINSSKIVITAAEEAEKYSINTLYPPHLADLHNFSKARNQETLTESENHLKQTLITSEWFLNAAEALFKLNIPSFILHDSGYSHSKNRRNFTIDVSYELMKRKGVRQELGNRPSTNISLRFKKIESLDNLIKQLHRDIEALEFYGKNGNLECELQDYLPKMLESDIYNQEPDLNSMWDWGWNETTFVFLEREEVVRDVEKHVLIGLLDELTRDLVHVYLLMKKT